MLKRKINLQLPVIRHVFLTSLEEFTQVVLDQQGASKDAHDLEYGPAQLEVVLNDCDETVGDDCDVDLYAHRILGLSPEFFDTEMLFDPFEEEFHLPAVSVKQCNILGGKVKVVCVVNKGTPKVCGIVNDSPKFGRIVVEVPLSCEPDGLVKKHAIQSVEYVHSREHLIFRLTFLPYDEECTAQMDGEQAGEVKVAPVEDITGQGLVSDDIHELGVVLFGRGDSVKYRYFSDDVNLGVDFDAGLCAAEVRPKEKRHAEVDCGGVNGIKPSVQLEFLRETSFLCKRNHIRSELLEDTRVADRVGLGYGVPAGRYFTETEMVRSFSMSGSYIGEFPEASATNQLPEHEREQMIPVGESPFLRLVDIFRHDSSELPLRQKQCDLSEDILSDIHFRTCFDSGTKMQISSLGQGVLFLSNCA